MILSERYAYSDAFIKRCGERLNFALANVPLYQTWQKHDPGASRTLDERYDTLPVLDKAAMRSSFPNGLAPASQNLQEGLDSNQIEYTFTSGTTQEKVINIFDPDWWSRSEAASWKLNATLARLPHPQKTAKLASALNVGVGCEEDLPMSHRILGDTLYLNEKINIIQWRPDHFARMAKELAEFRPAILEANPSLLARLAWWALDTGAKLYSPKAIVFTFEFPSALSLMAIRRVFSSPLISSYGTTETGFVLEECEAGLLHQNTDFCRIDFQPLKSDPEAGRLFVTTFDNPWNVVVRFDAGDLVRLHPEKKCPCGRHEGMIVEAVEGRASNLTFRLDGSLVTTKTLDSKLAASAETTGLRDYQMTQHAAKEYELTVMLSEQTPAAVASLQKELTALYGEGGPYTVTVVDSILPGPSGKFRRTGADFAFDVESLFSSPLRSTH